jgi:hypothetical protein
MIFCKFPDIVSKQKNAVFSLDPSGDCCLYRDPGTYQDLWFNALKVDQGMLGGAPHD